MKPHKHCELIKSWADGAPIQFFFPCAGWIDTVGAPTWEEELTYRVKPEGRKEIMQAEIAEIRAKLQELEDML